MSKLLFVLLGFGLAFFAGWLFATEVRPPLLDSVALAMWVALGLVGLLSLAIATAKG